MRTDAQVDAHLVGDTGHGSHQHVHHESGQAHGSMKGYLTGFILSVVLTAIPFWLVMADVIPNPLTATLVVVGFAFVQIIVHMIFFLHMDFQSEGGWTITALVFTLIVVMITLTGTLWVMYHLNTNMMPMMDQMGEMTVNGEKMAPEEGGHHAVPDSGTNGTSQQGGQQPEMQMDNGGHMEMPMDHSGHMR